MEISLQAELEALKKRVEAVEKFLKAGGAPTDSNGNIVIPNITTR